ncbi:hypothetical protein HK103_007473 [Boothiomyces macroporosus]|uniref:Apple domain-containing protein n=1 Tax=Boothiomyces macroporosus TaxID=261099 RepID=A0AAD5UCJ6_9FUNG|nr:hypothetical protein HK103_007473 [Boothiomyces macroporosus]
MLAIATLISVISAQNIVVGLCQHQSFTCEAEMTHDGDAVYSSGCYWTKGIQGTDLIGSVQVANSGCGNACTDNGSCSRFYWDPRNGVCYLFNGLVGDDTITFQSWGSDGVVNLCGFLISRQQCSISEGPTGIANINESIYCQ